MEFSKYGSTSRLNRDMVISEKIDGTNCCIGISEDGEVLAGKRSSWIEGDLDHMGFREWVLSNKDSLIRDLGPGIHRGEWYGYKIQHGYGLKENRFALFNTGKWADKEFETPNLECVPILYKGPFDTNVVDFHVNLLKKYGSRAVPGNMRPEGVIVYHSALGLPLKVTCENDETPKTVVKKRKEERNQLRESVSN
jgi:hypothetical protein